MAQAENKWKSRNGAAVVHGLDSRHTCLSGRSLIVQAFLLPLFLQELEEKCSLFPFFCVNKVLQIHSDILPNGAFLQKCRFRWIQSRQISPQPHSPLSYFLLFVALRAFLHLEDCYYMEVIQLQCHSVIRGACSGSLKQPEGCLPSGGFLLLEGGHRVVRFRHKIQEAQESGFWSHWMLKCLFNFSGLHCFSKEAS